MSVLATEMDLETEVEGGENRYVHQLPKSAKHPRLAQKLDIGQIDSCLVSWCHEAGRRAEPAVQLTVSLIDATGQPLRS